MESVCTLYYVAEAVLDVMSVQCAIWGGRRVRGEGGRGGGGRGRRNLRAPPSNICGVLLLNSYLKILLQLHRSLPVVVLPDEACLCLL